jgi:hypothetical protein
MAKRTGIPSLIKYLKRILALLAKFYDVLIALFPDDPDLQTLVVEMQTASTNFLTWLQGKRDIGD